MGGSVFSQLKSRFTGTGNGGSNHPTDVNGRTTNAADKNKEAVVYDANGRPLSSHSSSTTAENYNRDAVEIAETSAGAAQGGSGALPFLEMGTGGQKPGTHDRLTDSQQAAVDATVPGLFSKPLSNSTPLNATDLSQWGIKLGSIDLTQLKSHSDVKTALEAAGITWSVKEGSDTRFLLPNGNEGRIHIEKNWKQQVVEVVATVRNGEQEATATYTPGKGTVKEMGPSAESFAEISPLLGKAPDKMVLEAVERYIALGKQPTLQEMYTLVDSMTGMFKETLIRLLEERGVEVKELVEYAVTKAEKAGQTGLARLLRFRDHHYFSRWEGAVTKEQQQVFMRLAAALHEPRLEQGANGDVGKLDAFQHVLDALPKDQGPLLTPKQAMELIHGSWTDYVGKPWVNSRGEKTLLLDLESLSFSMRDKVASLLDQSGIVGTNGVKVPSEKWEETANSMETEAKRKDYYERHPEWAERPPPATYEAPPALDLGQMEIATHSTLKTEDGASFHVWTGKLDGKRVMLRTTRDGGLERLDWNTQLLRFENAGADGKSAPPQQVLVNGEQPKNPSSDPGMHMAELSAAAARSREIEANRAEAFRIVEGIKGPSGSVWADKPHEWRTSDGDLVLALEKGEVIRVGVDKPISHYYARDEIGGGTKAEAVGNLVEWNKLFAEPMIDPAGAKPPSNASPSDLAVWNLSRATGFAYSAKPGESHGFVRLENGKGEELTPWGAREILSKGGTIYATPMVAGASGGGTGYGAGIGYRAVGSKEAISGATPTLAIDAFVSTTARLEKVAAKAPSVYSDQVIEGERIFQGMDSKAFEASVAQAAKFSEGLRNAPYHEDLAARANGYLLTWELLKGVTMKEFQGSLKDQYGFELRPSTDGKVHYYRDLGGNYFQEVVFRHRGGELTSATLKQGGPAVMMEFTFFGVFPTWKTITSEVTLDYANAEVRAQGADWRRPSGGGGQSAESPASRSEARETIEAIVEGLGLNLSEALGGLNLSLPKENAPWEEVRKFHRDVLLAIHPDKVPEDLKGVATEIFKEYMNAAHALYPDKVT